MRNKFLGLFIFFSSFYVANSSKAMSFTFNTSRNTGSCRVTFSPSEDKFLVTKFEDESVGTTFSVQGTSLKEQAIAGIVNFGLNKLKTMPIVENTINQTTRRINLLGLLEYAASERGPSIQLQIEGRGQQAEISLDLMLSRQQVLNFFPSATYSLLEPFLHNDGLPIKIGPFRGRFTATGLSSANNGEPFAIELEAQHTSEFTDGRALIAKFFPENVAKVQAALTSMSAVSWLGGIAGGGRQQLRSGHVRVYRTHQSDGVVLYIPGQ